MDRNDFNDLMDDIIVRENLPGNSAAEPKKKVQIMVCADFEDSSIPQEKVRSLYLYSRGCQKAQSLYCIKSFMPATARRSTPRGSTTNKISKPILFFLVLFVHPRLHGRLTAVSPLRQTLLGGELAKSAAVSRREPEKHVNGNPRSNVEIENIKRHLICITAFACTPIP